MELKFVSNTWKTVENFLGYVEIHSKTPRALFSKLQVAEMCHLHEEKNNGDDIEIEWQSVDFTDWVKDIRKNIKEKSLFQNSENVEAFVVLQFECPACGEIHELPELINQDETTQYECYKEKAYITVHNSYFIDC